MIRWCFLILAFVLSCGAEESWQIVRVGRVDYVTLDSFAKFYGFRPLADSEPSNSFRLESAYGSLQLTLDSREMKWKGSRYWLCQSIRQMDGVVLIPRIDLVKTFDPLLRPNVEIPKRPLQGVVVDPGHGGGDEGTRANRGYSEKNANLDVAKRLVRLLDKAGIPWVLTRTKDRYVDHGDRSKLADDHPGYIFVSIHFNEDSSRETEGWETYALSPQFAPSTSSGGSFVGDEDQSWPGNSYDHHNFLLTQAIHRSAVLAKTNAPADRGSKKARFKVLRLANSPSVLVEGGFMSNPREAGLLKTEGYRQQVAEWIGEGILAYKRSQESVTNTARLKLSSTNTNEPGGVIRQASKNTNQVADFRPKTNSEISSTNLVVQGTNRAISNPVLGPNSSVREIPNFRAATNQEIRKAIPVVPEKKE